MTPTADHYLRETLEQLEALYACRAGASTSEERARIARECARLEARLVRIQQIDRGARCAGEVAHGCEVASVASFAHADELEVVAAFVAGEDSERLDRRVEDLEVLEELRSNYILRAIACEAFDSARRGLAA